MSHTKLRRIILDLDDVLADFYAGMAKAHGVSGEELLKHWPCGEWEGLRALGECKALGRPLTLGEFWEPIHALGDKFWLDLEPLPWFFNLIDLCIQKVAAKNIFVVSSPSSCPTSHIGKIHWIRKYVGGFGKPFDQFALTPHKEVFAGPGVLLIDDYDRNCRQFIKEGGMALVFPRWQNSCYRLRDYPFEYIKASLDLF